MKARSVRLAILSVGALAALSACGKKAPEGNVVESILSNSDVESAANALKLDPGEWELRVETLDMQGVGLPPEATRSGIGQVQTFKTCVTAEQGTDPGKVFLQGLDEAKCDVSQMQVKDGGVNAVISCPVPQQPSARMRTTLSGSYLPSSYALEMNSVIEGLPNEASITVKARNTGKRLGDCPADDGAENGAG